MLQLICLLLLQNALGSLGTAGGLLESPWVSFGQRSICVLNLKPTDTNEVARRFGELIPAPFELDFCDLSLLYF